MPAKLFSSSVNDLFGAKKRPWFGAENTVDSAAHPRLFSSRVMFAFVLFSLLIIGRVFSDVFCYLFLLAGVVFFVLYPMHECIEILVYILPFSPIMKFSLDSISMFTYLFFGLLLRMVVFNNRFDRLSFVAFAILGGYALVVSGYAHVTSVITIVAGMIMISKIDSYHVNAEASVVSYSIGLCLSSVLALFKDSLPLINQFIAVSRMKVDEGDFENRFAGLWGNPNYYTMDVIFLIACLAVILLSQKPRIIHYILVGGLTVFGIMSVSKSFLLSYAILLMLWFIASLRRGGASNATKFLFLGAILVGVVYYFAMDSINLFLFRFSADENVSLDTISTGRISIWTTYINTVVENPRILLLGNGLDTWEDVGAGTHNTYLELLFSFGLFGSFFFLFALARAFNGVQKKALLLLPVSVLMIRMFAIGVLTYDAIWIYFILIKTLSHMLTKEEEPLTERPHKDWFFGRVYG